MKVQLFLIFLFATINLLAQNNYPISSLSYPLSAFNADTCCWRKLSQEDHNEEAAQLILSYYKQNKQSVNRQPLYWHAGQCFALTGQNEMAIRYMKRTYSSFLHRFGGEDGMKWYYYARGTVAFLERDKKKLSSIIEKWKLRYPDELNYNALVEMYEKWALPYKEINQKRSQLK